MPRRSGCGPRPSTRSTSPRSRRAPTIRAAAPRPPSQLYAGDLAEGLAHDCFAAERERLADRYEDALATVAATRLEAGDHDGARQAAERLLLRDPLREEAHAVLIAVYGRDGTRSQVVRQYRRLCAVLARELDESPLPETDATYRAALLRTVERSRDVATTDRAGDGPASWSPSSAERSLIVLIDASRPAGEPAGLDVGLRRSLGLLVHVHLHETGGADALDADRRPGRRERDAGPARCSRSPDRERPIALGVVELPDWPGAVRSTAGPCWWYAGRSCRSSAGRRWSRTTGSRGRHTFPLSGRMSWSGWASTGR